MMLRPIGLMVTLAGGVLIAPPAADAKQAGKAGR